MYPHSIKQWCPFVGCRHNCTYCPSSFQAQLKRWAKGNCRQCYDFAPHTHEERLNQKLPKTAYLQFIFTCSSGDIAFCPDDYLQQIVDRIRNQKDKTFLIQSKNPRTFNRMAFPDNVILGVTLETSKDVVYEGISKAPKPSCRYKDFLKVRHPAKMVTIEPVLDFDIDVMMRWVEDINPCMVWLGYDSRRNHLQEPALEKVKSLYWELGRSGLTVVLKKIRPAWWEKRLSKEGKCEYRKSI